MKNTTALSFAFLAFACSCVGNIPDIGKGFRSDALSAPWDTLSNDTRFTCHSTADAFFFNFEVADSTLALTEPFTNEMDVDPEDRVEVFFCPDRKMKEYFCAEIDPLGRVMDYKARFYRDFDYGWNFSTLQVRSELTPWGYRVMGSVSLDELRSLGVNTEKGFGMGVFQADFTPEGSVHWYSLVPTDDVSPDFHKPDVLFACRMTPMQERRGVVVYPSDITSVGVGEWERRIDLSGINLIGIHAATSHEPVDVLENFVKSDVGKSFLEMCGRRGVDVEYEIHALQFILPRNLFDAHPEWFREDEEGVRQCRYNMCFTSEEAVGAMRLQIAALMDWMRPTTHRYFIWPDDKIGKFCHCEKCRDFSPSEQALIYENNLLKLLREYDPEATIAHLAYNQTLSAPKKVRASEGVFLEFAPISRDYSRPLSEEAACALRENALAFPTFSQHILEYWLDESMFSNWKRDNLVPMVFKRDQCRRDVEMYRTFGANSITTFATWLGGDYVGLYGPTDGIFSEYGASF